MVRKTHQGRIGPGLATGPDQYANLRARGGRIVDRRSRTIHGTANRAAKVDRRNRDGRADDGENEGVFGSRGARDVLQEFDELLHSTFLSSVRPRHMRGAAPVTTVEEVGC